VTPTTTEFTSGIKQQENFILFANQWLTAGNHTFELEITNCVNQVFELDYILYNPAFRTLATKTSLPSDQSSSTATSTATKKSSHVAAIVGGVVGSIVCLLVMLILLLYRRRFLHRHAFSKSMTTIGTFFFSPGVDCFLKRNITQAPPVRSLSHPLSFLQTGQLYLKPEHQY
jgi:hypothetical protein